MVFVGMCLFVSVPAAATAHFYCPRSDGPCNDALQRVRGMFLVLCMWFWMGLHTPVSACCAVGGPLCPSCVTRALCSVPVCLLCDQVRMNASAAGVVRAPEPARACVASAPSITRMVFGPAPVSQCCVAGAETRPLVLGVSVWVLLCLCVCLSVSHNKALQAALGLPPWVSAAFGA